MMCNKDYMKHIDVVVDSFAWQPKPGMELNLNKRESMKAY